MIGSSEKYADVWASGRQPIPRTTSSVWPNVQASLLAGWLYICTRPRLHLPKTGTAGTSYRRLLPNVLTRQTPTATTARRWHVREGSIDYIPSGSSELQVETLMASLGAAVKQQLAADQYQ